MPSGCESQGVHRGAGRKAIDVEVSGGKVVNEQRRFVRRKRRISSAFTRRLESDMLCDNYMTLHSTCQALSPQDIGTLGIAATPVTSIRNVRAGKLESTHISPVSRP